jgi:transposase
MIQLTPHMRILVAVEPADFRAGIDGLVRVCRQRLAADPFSGTLFVFANRRRTAIKVLIYDGTGFWLCHKRLSKQQFRYWPQRGGEHPAQCVLQAHELQVLLMGGDPAAAKGAPLWRQLPMAA